MTTTNRLATVDAYAVTVLTDGTTTVAEVTVKTSYGPPVAIGTGYARRRKGDPRSPAVGELLATARAFEDAARTARVELATLGYEDEK